ncbi:AMP-binding protein [Bacillus lacus]|uniref:AMP-binding protein n=1 Tax=Metabacillus lacus TaxID=1983721 RepID=A0A7X2J0Y5_9BACI|nr:AMP-binding protein [Metabacillus lacus]MRX73244.1 AMP-binding protein [Metabacillus lacus]
MMFINDTYYNLEDFETQFEILEENSFWRDCGSKRLAVCLEDAFLFLAAAFFIRSKGGTLIPIPASSPPEAAVRLADRASADLLFYQSQISPTEFQQKKKGKSGQLVGFSSGTTGEPKCIERSWNAIETEIDSYNEHFPLKENLQPVIACPVTHSFGLISGVFSALRRGSQPLIITEKNPKYLLKKLKEQREHLLYASPVLLFTVVRLLKSTESLYAVMSSGAMLTERQLKLLKEKTHLVLQQYGCSEAGCIAAGIACSAEEMGLPLPHLAVSAGKSMEEPGEILVESSGSILHTRDWGYVREDGVLCFLSRMDDMINVAGLNVYPQEVEAILLEAEGIVEAAVYKKADKLAGERVCAQVVVNGPLQEEKLREWCRQNLQAHQIPVDIHIVEAIQTSANGKLNRKRLGEMVL